MSDKELIWVEKEFAERYKVLESEKSKNDERCKVLDEYIAKISESSRNDFKANLEAMEEDAAIYAGLMLKVKQAFGKAKEEALESSYALWEEYDKERPDISNKISNIVALLKPLTSELAEINNLLGNINTYNFDKLTDSIARVNGLYGESRDMFEFLVSNFKPKAKE